MKQWFWLKARSLNKKMTIIEGPWDARSAESLRRTVQKIGLFVISVNPLRPGDLTRKHHKLESSILLR